MILRGNGVDRQHESSLCAVSGIDPQVAAGGCDERELMLGRRRVSLIAVSMLLPASERVTRRGEFSDIPRLWEALLPLAADYRRMTSKPETNIATE